MTVTVRGAGRELSARAAPQSSASVEAGGRVSTQVLGDWVDPGRRRVLPAARPWSASRPHDATSRRRRGVRRLGRRQGAERSVALMVSDGRRHRPRQPRGHGQRARRRADRHRAVGRARDRRPGDHASVRCAHVRGGERAGPAQRRAREGREHASSPSFEAGTFTLPSDEVRTHYLEFTVTDGDADRDRHRARRRRRAARREHPPITVPQTIFVTTLNSRPTSTPTTTDIDPAGGVLVVTGVDDTGSTDGRAHRDHRPAPGPGDPVRPLETGRRRSTTGSATAWPRRRATITVVEMQPRERTQPPVGDRRLGDRPRRRRRRHPRARQRRASRRPADHARARARRWMPDARPALRRR